MLRQKGNNRKVVAFLSKESGCVVVFHLPPGFAGLAALLWGAKAPVVASNAPPRCPSCARGRAFCFFFLFAKTNLANRRGKPMCLPDNSGLIPANNQSSMVWADTACRVHAIKLLPCFRGGGRRPEGLSPSFFASFFVRENEPREL